MRSATIPVVVLAGMCVPVSAQPIFNIQSSYRTVAVAREEPAGSGQTVTDEIVTHDLHLWEALINDGSPPIASQRSVAGPHWIGGRLSASGETLTNGTTLWANSWLDVRFSLAEANEIEHFRVTGDPGFPGESEAYLQIEQFAPVSAVMRFEPDAYSMPFTLTLEPGDYWLTASAWASMYGAGSWISFGIPSPGTLACLAFAGLLVSGRRRR